MFGASGRIAAARKVSRIAVTQGQDFVSLDTYTGYDDGTHGPNSAIGSRLPTTYKGVSIEGLVYVDTTITDTFRVHLQGNRAQSFFRTVTPEGGDTYESSAASYSYVGGGDYTTWSWSFSSQPTEWDGSGLVRVTFT